MIRFRAIVKRVIRELVRDKRTLALMLFAPLLVLTLMNIIFNSSNDNVISVGVNETVPTAIVDSFPEDKVKVYSYNDKKNGEEMIKSHDLDAFLSLNDDTFHLTFRNEDPSVSAQTKALFSGILMQNKLKEMGSTLKEIAIQTNTPLKQDSYEIDYTYVYGDEDGTFFDRLLPVLIGFFVFFFVFLISGIALLKERTSGTLERLLSTPVKRSELIYGYMVGYGLFAIIQTLVIVFFSIYVLNVDVANSLWLVLLINIILSLVSLTMGIFISTFANSEFQMMQFIPLIVMPQIFFSGIVSLDTMPEWIRGLSYFFPLTYAADALTATIVKGEGLSSIGFDLTILLLFIVFFTGLNIVGLKRYRKV